MADPRLESTYLRALLDAQLYIHLPLSDDSGKVHSMMFTRLDGLTVIPLFTELPPARAAAGRAVRVMALGGHELFEATLGVTLMLDPNEISMTLYPEELAELLDEGVAASAPVAFEGPGLELLPADPRDAWLMDLLTSALGPSRQRNGFTCATAIESNPHEPSLPIDLTTYEPLETPPSSISSGFEHAWTRELRETKKPFAPH